MSHARQANLLGTLSLAVAERVRTATDAASPHGGSVPAALVALHEFLDRPSIDDLARVLELSHSGTVRLVDRLCDAGLVTRSAGADPRAVALTLTDHGRGTARRVRDARLEALEDVLAPLDDEQRAALTQVMEALLGELAAGRTWARHACRMCHVDACGHHEGRCPITEANRQRSAAQTVA